MIEKMVEGSFEEVMIVDTPAAVAISEAMSLVSIPPVPRDEPSVSVLTTNENYHKNRNDLVYIVWTHTAKTSGRMEEGANEP